MPGPSADVQGPVQPSVPDVVPLQALPFCEARQQRVPWALERAPLQHHALARVLQLGRPSHKGWSEAGTAHVHQQHWLP